MGVLASEASITFVTQSCASFITYFIVMPYCSSSSARFLGRFSCTTVGPKEYGSFSSSTAQQK